MSPLPPTPEEVASAQATLAAANDAANAQDAPAATASIAQAAAPATEAVTAPTVAELEAKVKELQTQVPKPETDAQKIARLEAQLLSQTGAQTGALSQSLHYTNPDIPLAAIEPGIRWAVKQGLMDAEAIGPHIVELLEDGLL